MPTRNFKRVYVWQLPVRIFHWLNALAIVVLSITGFLISNPPAIMSNAEAYDSFWFGTVRTVHFISAYVFFGVMILRIYWAFVGNKFENWRAFLPVNKRGFHNFFHVLKHDVFLLPEKNPKLADISIGHNSVAAWSYIVMFLLALVMVFTGFGLYADNATWWLPKMFSWVPSVFGGDFGTRLAHHISMWFILLFIIIHVYLVLYHDWLDGRGETSAMISGYKFVRTERIEAEKFDLDLGVDEDFVDVEGKSKKK